MGALRMILIGVLGAGAGALLATSTIPSFAPYRERADSRPYRDESDDGQAYALAHSARERGGTEPAEPGLAIRLGAERGTLVLELPSWAGEIVEWMGFGRRVWNDWRGFTERFEDMPQRTFREAPGEQDWQDAPSGYEQRRSDRAQDRYGYAGSYTLRGDESPPGLSQSPVERSVDGEDPATVAARRAAEAARDVMAAQDQ